MAAGGGGWGGQLGPGVGGCGTNEPAPACMPACLPSPMWARPEAGRVRREAGCAKPWHSVRAVLCRAVLWVLSCAVSAELCCRC